MADHSEPEADEETLKPGNYRRTALSHYRSLLEPGSPLLCVVCGFGIEAVLEVAHLNQKRSDSSLPNLALLCPTCHKMLDLGLIPVETVALLRDAQAKPNWALRMKDAAPKAAATRKKAALARKRSASAKKAWQTRDERDAEGGA